MTVGSLLCDECCPASGRITLGTIPEEKQDIKLKDGTIRTITHSAQDVSIPSILRDVVGYENGLCKLACGHVRAELPLISAQEHLILPNGDILRGEGLPAPDSHVSHRAAYRMRPR
jgi:hypothetical protein